MKKSYKEVVDTISNSRRFENRPGVEITGIMLDRLNHPEKHIPFVHIAGTNGKGSTCAFLSSILMEMGLKVGVFTSPHLVDFEERITINNSQISKADVERIGNILLSTDFGVRPTMFDYCVAMAMVYFKEENVDIMIIETGLGGRLDSTNSIGLPLVSIITKIGFDHTAFLGNSLREIASEKAGIIKNGSKIVIESQETEAMDLLKAVAEKEADQAYRIVSAEDIDKASKLPLKIPGIHQYENAAAARLAAEYLVDINNMDRHKATLAIEEGLKKALWPGRMEILSETPFLMVDGAHNGHGVAALRKSLISLYPGEKFHFIMGVMADKDYPQMVEELLPYAIDFATVTPESSRALQAEELAAFIESKGVKAKSYDHEEEFLKELNTDAKTIVFGSLYFVGDVKKYFLK